MFNKNKKNNKGFTLVELLVVIAIMGILAVVAVPSLFKNIEKAKVADVVAYVNAVKTEAMSQYADLGGTATTTSITPESVKGALNGSEPTGVTLEALSVNGTTGKVTMTIKVPSNISSRVTSQIRDSSVTVTPVP